MPYQRHQFPRKYTPADVILLAKTDELHMCLSGPATKKIAITLNQTGIRTKSGSLWYPLTIRRILRNQTYTGKTYFGKTKRVGKTRVEVQPQENWILLPDITPPILTDEIFNRAQEAMEDARDARLAKPNAAV